METWPSLARLRTPGRPQKHTCCWGEFLVSISELAPASGLSKWGSVVRRLCMGVGVVTQVGRTLWLRDLDL